MATYSKVKLSGGTDGKPVLVVAGGTPGTTIHTAHATDLDEIWLWAFNSHSADVLLTIEYGGTTDPDHLIEVTIPFQEGLKLVVPGLLLTNSLVVQAFAGTTNVININGYVNRITA